MLVEPEIPQNTGNIVRTCAATDTVLHLVGPLGFSMRDRYLKRAGLDYWEIASVERHDSLEELKAKFPGRTFYFTSKKATRLYTDVKYGPDDFLVFGKETEGLPEELLQANAKHCLKIPKLDEARSLNLSNCVAVVLYEALRQQEFDAGVKLT